MINDEYKVAVYTAFTVYDSEGRILRTGNAPEDQAHFQAIKSQGELLILSASNMNTDFILDGEVHQLPPKPSEYHIFNYVERVWVDPRTFFDLKGAKWEAVKAARDQAEFGVFEWDGLPFDGDAVSQNRIRDAAQDAARSPAFARVWTLADNTFRDLNSADMTAVAAALNAHIDLQHSLARELRTQINAATTAAQLDGIRWPASIV